MTGIALLLVLLASGEAVRGHPSSAYLATPLPALGPQSVGRGTTAWAPGAPPAVVAAAAIPGEAVGATLLDVAPYTTRMDRQRDRAARRLHRAARQRRRGATRTPRTVGAAGHGGGDGTR